MTSVEFSSCNSRNLNLSPFCQLTSTSTTLAMQMWQPSVLKTYGDKTTSYVEGISGPLRDKYSDAMEKEELITSLTQDQIPYNAYDKDIAIVNIFFGDSTVFEFE